MRHGQIVRDAGALVQLDDALPAPSNERVPDVRPVTAGPATREGEMKRLMVLILAVAFAAALAAPVAAGKPSGAVFQSACLFTASDATGTWAGLRVTVDWSRTRVDRIYSEVIGQTVGVEAVVAADDHLLDRALRSGSYTAELWPMKYWYDVPWDQPARWAAATFSHYRVLVSAGARLVLDYDSFYDANFTLDTCS